MGIVSNDAAHVIGLHGHEDAVSGFSEIMYSNGPVLSEAGYR